MYFSFILKEKPSSNCAVSKTLFITIKFMLCEIIKVDFIPFAYPSIKYQSFMLELYACKNFPGFYNFFVPSRYQSFHQRSYAKKQLCWNVQFSRAYDECQKLKFDYYIWIFKKNWSNVRLYHTLLYYNASFLDKWMKDIIIFHI